MALLVSATSGCTTAAKEVFGFLRGGTGSVVAIQPLAADPEARPLGEYRNVELGEITDETGGLVPAAFWTQLQREVPQELAGRGIPLESGGKTLVIRGRILHYETHGLMGLALSDVEEVVARLQMVDKDTGNVLAVANCIGRTKNRTNRGVETKVDGLAEAIAVWVDDRYPKEGRVEPE